MLLDPWQDVRQVEDGPRWGTDRVREWLKGEGAEIERKALECCMRTASFGLANASSSTG